MAFLSLLVPDVVLFCSYSSDDGTSRQETGSMAADNRMAVQARFSMLSRLPWNNHFDCLNIHTITNFFSPAHLLLSKSKVDTGKPTTFLNWAQFPPHHSWLIYNMCLELISSSYLCRAATASSALRERRWPSVTGLTRQVSFNADATGQPRK
jgi:hypothetical protein